MNRRNFVKNCAILAASLWILTPKASTAVEPTECFITFTAKSGKTTKMPIKAHTGQIELNDWGAPIPVGARKDAVIGHRIDKAAVPLMPTARWEMVTGDNSLTNGFSR